MKEKRKVLKIASIFSPVKMRRQPAIFPLSVEYLSPTQFLGSVKTKTTQIKAFAAFSSGYSAYHCIKHFDWAVFYFSLQVLPF